MNIFLSLSRPENPKSTDPPRRIRAYRNVTAVDYAVGNRTVLRPSSAASGGIAIGICRQNAPGIIRACADCGQSTLWGAAVAVAVLPLLLLLIPNEQFDSAPVPSTTARTTISSFHNSSSVQ
jgi:hypothetical protein